MKYLKIFPVLLIALTVSSKPLFSGSTFENEKKAIWEIAKIHTEKYYSFYGGTVFPGYKTVEEVYKRILRMLSEKDRMSIIISNPKTVIVHLSHGFENFAFHTYFVKKEGDSYRLIAQIVHNAGDLVLLFHKDSKGIYHKARSSNADLRMYNGDLLVYRRSEVEERFHILSQMREDILTQTSEDIFEYIEPAYGPKVYTANALKKRYEMRGFSSYWLDERDKAYPLDRLHNPFFN